MFDTSLHGMVDICPTPALCEMAVELLQNGTKHVSKFNVVGLNFPTGSENNVPQKLAKKVCEFYSAQFTSENKLDHSSVGTSNLERLHLQSYANRRQPRNPKERRRRRTQGS